MEDDDEVTSSSSSAQPLDRMSIDQNHIRITPKITCQNSRDSVSGLRTERSMSKEWTNERHSLFLDSMEASFVRRLHNHEYDSVDKLGHHSRMDNLQDPNQFKMLQSGCWKKTNFEFSQPKTKAVDGRRALLDNQWIRHFRHGGKHQEFTLPIQNENGASSGDSIYPRGQKLEGFEAASCGATMRSKKLDVGYFHERDQDYVIENSEVSDQNFVNEDKEETHCKGKKMKKATTYVQIRDQVVPLSQYATTEDLNESRAYPTKGNISLDEQQLESMNDSTCAL